MSLLLAFQGAPVAPSLPLRMLMGVGLTLLLYINLVRVMLRDLEEITC